MEADSLKSGLDKTAISAYQSALQQSVEVLAGLGSFEKNVALAAEWCLETFRQGGKLLTFGNGGSACEAQHLAGELIGRYKSNRKPLPAIALNADTAVITCIGNDFTFDDVFARQLEGLGRRGDLVVAFSTSGNSRNVLRALEAARRISIRSITFLGRDWRRCRKVFGLAPGRASS